MYKAFLICLILGGFLSSPAQASIVDHRNRFALGFLIQQHHFGLRISPEDKSQSSRVVYRPNTEALAGYQISLLGLTIAFLNSGTRDQGELFRRGETSYEDLRGQLFFGRRNQYVISGYYNRYKGLYIENSSDIDPSLSPSDPLIQRPDISIFNAGASLMFLNDPTDYSAAAAFAQSAQQKESGGSLLLLASADNTLMKADSPIIPAAVRSQFGAEGEFQDGGFYTFSVAIGYGHAFVWNNLFFALEGLVGKGLQYRNYNLNGSQQTSTTNVFKTRIGASTGYNGKDFYIGVAFQQHEVSYTLKSLAVGNNLSTTQVYTGYRF